MKTAVMAHLANRYRLAYLRMVEGSREALIPSAFSMIDIVTHLYKNDLILNQHRLDVIVSKGHAASVLYPFLAEKYDIDIKYGVDGSPFAIYANTEIPCIAMPSGSLGHGLGVAAGYHIAASPQHQTFVFLGDGECFEGSIWESLNMISNLALSNIVPVIDYNNRTILGDLDKTFPSYNLLDKLRGFGFVVYEINGHDFAEISSAVESCVKATAPSLIFARTIKGKGIKFMEESHLWHNRMPSQEQMTESMAILANL